MWNLADYIVHHIVTVENIKNNPEGLNRDSSIF